MSCYNSTVINAPIEDVWERISDFYDMSWAKGVIDNVKKVGPTNGHRVGAQRILNDAFKETLTYYSNDEHRFMYTIDDGPGPLDKSTTQNYVGDVKLIPVTDENKTLMLWTSDFNSKNSDAVEDFCNPIYRGILKAAKNSIENKS